MSYVKKKQVLKRRAAEKEATGVPKAGSKPNASPTVSKAEEGQSKPAEALSIEDRKVGNYQLMEKIGKGGFGTVYKGINRTTGITVAVKRVDLRGLKAGEVEDIEQEFKLLENLHHPNIVNYEDNIRHSGFLHIILEFVENGSLSHLFANFGDRPPEPLLAHYIEEILKGLKYLHDQGVIHRDIKGANVLTNKAGHVKLTDFGVATKLSSKAGFEEAAIGTPYWMAPEIIEMTQQSSACDVWSLGCTVIELLTGKPPFFEVNPMAALYQIVTSDMVLPEGISSSLSEFLRECFQKDPDRRITAAGLLKHPWIKKFAPKATGGVIQHVRARSRMQTEFDYDDISPSLNLAAANKPRASSTANVPPSVTISTDILKEKSLVDFVEADDDEDFQGVELNLNKAKPMKQEKQRSEDESKLLAIDTRDDDELDEDPFENMEFDDQDQKTLDQSKQLNTFKQLVATLSQVANAERWGVVVALDSAALDGENSGRPSLSSAGSSSANNSAKGGSSSSLAGAVSIAAAQLGKLPRQVVEEDDEFEFEVEDDDGPDRSHGAPQGPSFTKVCDEIKALLQSPTTDAETRMEMTRHSIIPVLETLRDYQEAADPGNLDGQYTASILATLQLINLLNRTHVTPGASAVMGSSSPSKTSPSPTPRNSGVIPPPSPAASSKKGKLVSSLLGRFEEASASSSLPSQEKAPTSAMNELDDDVLETMCMMGIIPAVFHFAETRYPLSIRLEATWMIKYFCYFTKARFISCGGLAVLPTLLSTTYKEEGEEIVRMGIDCIERAFQSTTPSKASLCYFFCKNELLSPLAYALQQLHEAAIKRPPITPTSSTTTTTSSVPVTSSKSQNHAIGSKTLTSPKVHSPPNPGHQYNTSQPSLGRQQTQLASSATLTNAPKSKPALPRSHTVVERPASLQLPMSVESQYLGKALEILSTLSLAGPYVQEFFAKPEVIGPLVVVVSTLESSVNNRYLSPLLHIFVAMASNPTNLDLFESTGAIPKLVSLLGGAIKAKHREIEKDVLTTLFHLCKVKTTRLEQTAVAGIIPWLQQIISGSNPLRHFALPIMFNFAKTGSKICQEELKKYNGVRFFLDLLPELYNRMDALEALTQWLCDDTEYVENILAQANNIHALVSLFQSAQAVVQFERIMTRFEKILSTSDVINIALADYENGLFINLLETRLTKHGNNNNIRVSLLRMLNFVFSVHPEPSRLLATHTRLHPLCLDLASQQQSSVIVSQLATRLLDRIAAEVSGGFASTTITTEQGQGTSEWDRPQRDRASSALQNKARLAILKGTLDQDSLLDLEE